jgi:hypothetical protein
MHDDELIPLQRTAILKRLRDLFRELGGSMPPRVLTDEAIARGVVPTEVLASCQTRGLTELCRLALKGKTEDRLPFAKPTSTDEDAGEWKQLELFTYAQAEALILREARGLVADYHELLRLHRWCLAKFGRAPEIPELTETELA